MSDTVIQVSDLAKEYRIGAAQGSYRTLRESMTDALAAPLKRLRNVLQGKAAHAEQESFWALKGVSFEVKRGEVVGVIGRNGAGKSTLLKILSRITEPTRGEIRLKGRVGALLEVGTGFHPELTGRENIFLNGALLGMKRAEIQKKFDEIVEFAEIAKFLDTPVKHYSSGMYVRLAFAVAAHLEPEVLIIDEVLAVGDLAFQQKCLGKMGQVASSGRTILFVSHQLATVRQHCTRGILLDGGLIRADGPVADTVEEYVSTGRTTSGEHLWSQPPNSQGFQPLALRVRGAAGEVTDVLPSAEPFRVEFDYQLTQEIRELRVILYFQSWNGEMLFLSRDRDDEQLYRRLAQRPPGRYRATCTVPGNLLNQGRYSIGVNAGIFNVARLFQEERVLSVRVDTTGSFAPHWPASDYSGYFRMPLAWSVVPLEEAESGKGGNVN